jgi:hypothetical protein
MELEEVLGFISELKEQKNCSVVMILNEDELSDNKEETLLFAYSISSRKEEVCALMAAISIILPTISVVTSGTSLISDSIKENRIS